MVMPGFTHLQPAQPVTFGHHLLAYVEMLARDAGRFNDARKRLNECPLGAAALAGTSFPIDRDMTAKALGFDRPTANSLDSVADRDFALEALSAAAIAATHLSRFAEEIVLWTTPQFGFVRLSDAFTTGSSIMPQKRNPDVFELVRARGATALACLTEALAICAKLPSGYQRDLQLLKFPLFRGIDCSGQTLEIVAAALDGLHFRPDRIRLDPSVHAAEEANALVVQEGIPFREAYQRVAARYRR
jgi:argininosuccinate lyase